MRFIEYRSLAPPFLAVFSSVAIASVATADTNYGVSAEAISLVQHYARQVGETNVDADGTKGVPVAMKHHKPVNEHHDYSGKDHGPSDVSSRASASLLGDVSDAMRKSHDDFQKLGAQMKALEVLMEHVQHQNVAALGTQKAEYDRLLQRETSEIHAMESSNLVLKAEIEDLRKSNSDLRKSAERMMSKNTNLKLQLDGFNANLSVAAEFTANVSAAADLQLHNATELAILDELDQRDATSAKNLTREHWITSMGTEHSMLMLQVPPTTQHTSPVLQPEALMKSLLASFGQVSEEQNASEASLREAYDKESRLGAQQYAVLLDAQAELRSIKAKETLIHERLASAVAHLEKVHEQLSAHTSNLRHFAKRIGEQMPVAKA